MLPSGNRDRLVDCAEELVKYTIIMRPQFDLFSDRFSERKDRAAKEARQAEVQAREKADDGDNVNGIAVKSI